MQQLGMIEGRAVVSGCIHFDHATITVPGDVLAGKEDQVTMSMSNAAPESDIARIAMSGIMDGLPCGHLSVSGRIVYVSSKSFQSSICCPKLPSRNFEFLEPKECAKLAPTTDVGMNSLTLP